MIVKDALVNTGQLGMKTGFQNARLPNVLGPCWKTEGGFAFSFQISFRLDEVDPDQIKLVRKAVAQTLYRDPTGLKQQVKDILHSPLSSEDSPDEKNVKREAHRNYKGEICGGEVTVWDAPGPRHLIAVDPRYYPIEFQGRFEVHVIHQPTQTKLYSIEYLVGLRATAPRGEIIPCTAFPHKFDVLRRNHAATA
jgi:hypothetical protein